MTFLLIFIYNYKRSGSGPYSNSKTFEYGYLRLGSISVKSEQFTSHELCNNKNWRQCRRQKVANRWFFIYEYKWMFKPSLPSMWLIYWKFRHNCDTKKHKKLFKYYFKISRCLWESLGTNNRIRAQIGQYKLTSHYPKSLYNMSSAYTETLRLQSRQAYIENFQY